MTDADIADNPTVLVHISFGERENVLGNSLDKDLTLDVASGMTFLIIGGIVVILIIITTVILLKRRKK